MGSRDARGCTNHLDSKGHAIGLKESHEEGACSANLLRRAKTLARELPNAAIRVALRRVMVGDKSRKAAEGRAKLEVEGVATVTQVITKESTSGRVNGTVDQMCINGVGGQGREGAAKAIAPRESKGSRKA